MAHSCCNPFDLPGHNWNTRQKNLRSVTTWMCERAPIFMDSNICDTCRKKLSNTTVGGYVESVELELVSEVSLECWFNWGNFRIKSVPVWDWRDSLHQAQDPSTSLSRSEDKENNWRIETNNSYCDVIMEIKMKSLNSWERNSKWVHQEVNNYRSLQFCQTWSLKKIQTVFQTSDYMARRSKKLVKEKGILSTPNPINLVVLSTN